MRESSTTLDPQASNPFPNCGTRLADVRSYCKLRCDLSGLTKAELESGEMEDGTKYYIVEYDLIVQFGPALNAFSVERKGVSYGIVEAEY